MLPDELLANLPTNLSPAALRDLAHILRHSAHEWGVTTARRTRARLVARIASIADGSAVGHRRQDVRRPFLFLSEPPWVIAYDPATRRVLRILHGARDFPALFGA